MGKPPYRKSKSTRKPRTPATAADAQVFVRTFMLELFRRYDGKAVDSPLIAEALLLEAFHFLDQQPHAPRVRKLLRRIEGGVYARITALVEETYAQTYQETGPQTEAPLPDFEGLQIHFSDRAGVGDPARAADAT